MTPSPPVDEPTQPPAAMPPWPERPGSPPRGPLLLGIVASLLMLVGSFGAGGVLVRDPILTNSPLGFWRYGHGQILAAILVYIGVGLMAWAWVRLGREVLAGRCRGRAVIATGLAWMVPLLCGPPLFTRDVFSYLAQGGLPLAGFDPYAVGPEAMPGIFTENVHFFWQDTPAPYGPLFILLAKGVAAFAGDNIILGVVAMRLALLPGLVLVIWALPGLTRRLGGSVPVTLWIMVANPFMVIHMVGGGHNDLLMIGLLVAGCLVGLSDVPVRGHNLGPVLGIMIVTAAMAVKASAAIALPFLVLVWAMHMTGTQNARIVKATAAGIAVFAAVFAAFTVTAGVSLGWLPALSAPSMIVNWMSLPTGIGQFIHLLVSIFIPVPMQPFVNVTRAIGGIVLLVIAVRQWLAARDGGPDAIRRAGVVFLATAVLSPAMLPWYLTWGMVILAATAWTLRGLQIMAFVSLMLVILYYVNGEDALYNPPYLILCAAMAGLAAVSLGRPDPLRLAAGARRPAPEFATPAGPATARGPAPAGPTPAGAPQRTG